MIPLVTLGNLPVFPGWLRLILASVALVHTLLCLRVVGIRAVRHFRRDEAAHAERTPTASMVAYGLLTAHISVVMFRRLPEDTGLVTIDAWFFSAALIAGTIAFTQIVALVRGADLRRR